MSLLVRVCVSVCALCVVLSTDPGCVIELECAECLPEHPPLVTSRLPAAEGRLALGPGDEVQLSCPGGRLLTYPLLGAARAVCERGRYRVSHDGSLRHLLELGCQEDVFEDVMHQVEHCGSALQGRAYRVQEGGTWRHLATLCWDPDRAVPVHAHVSNADLVLPAHSDARAPLSLLGNFNHMFDATTRRDAERLYGDDGAMNRRLRELFKHDDFFFADQSLTSAKILSAHYFRDQNVRVTEFVSNKVGVWRSVARGNLRSVHRDMGAALRGSAAPLHLYSGTHGVLALRGAAGAAGGEVFLRAGGRFPAPRYLWTVLLDRAASRALAVVVLNDPFVAVSDIRAAIFCESACSRVPWLRSLRRGRRYETPLYGLTFCCNVHEFASVVSEMPKAVLQGIPFGDDGLLLNVTQQH